MGKQGEKKVVIYPNGKKARCHYDEMLHLTAMEMEGGIQTFYYDGNVASMEDVVRGNGAVPETLNRMGTAGGIRLGWWIMMERFQFWEYW